MEREEMQIFGRENVYYGAAECTCFSVRVWDEARRAYVFAGRYTADGHDATEEQCKRAAARAMLESDD
jgi:endonuclease V-like protein UPF0215 family